MNFIKRTYYNVAVRLKEAVNGIHTHRYEKCYKVKYRMRGDNAKFWFYDKAGKIRTEEFSNVSWI